MSDEQLDRVLDHMVKGWMTGNMTLLGGGQKLIDLALKHGGLTEDRLKDGMKRLADAAAHLRHSMSKVGTA